MVIRAAFFDLDGTLLQSEKLKAQAYAQAPQQVLGLDNPDQRAVEAYREIVGSSREVASRHVMEQLDMEEALVPLVNTLAATDPADALTKLRVGIYETMVADQQLLLDNRWPHTIALLQLWSEEGCSTAVATMSTRNEATRVLEVIGVLPLLSFVLTREDVANPKPDPEIYLLAASRAGIPPNECMVVEDSPTGVQAGLAAGMHVIAAATPFTECGLRGAPGLDQQWVVHDPLKLIPTVQRLMAKQGRSGSLVL